MYSDHVATRIIFTNCLQSFRIPSTLAGVLYRSRQIEFYVYLPNSCTIIFAFTIENGIKVLASALGAKTLAFNLPCSFLFLLFDSFWTSMFSSLAVFFCERFYIRYEFITSRYRLTIASSSSSP